MTKQRVAVVGAGIMGRLMAFHLAETGHGVTLFDHRTRQGTGSCSWVAGGMLTPFAELEKAEPVIATLGVRSLEQWQSLIPRLARNVYYQREGNLVLAHRQDMPDLEAFRTKVQAKLLRLGQLDRSQMEEIGPQRLSQLEPELEGRFDRAMYFPEEAQLEPRELLPALARSLQEREVEWLDHTQITRLEPGLVGYNDQVRRFELVVDCRGLGARAELNTLRGVRGELIRFHAPEVRLRRIIRLIHPRYPLYIVPRPGETYVIGATTIESEDNGPMTVRSCLELLSAVYSLHPGFAEATILEQASACRPAFIDNLPRLFYQDGLLNINGLYRHGYLIAPALAAEAMRIINRETLHFPELCEEAHAPAYC